MNKINEMFLFRLLNTLNNKGHNNVLCINDEFFTYEELRDAIISIKEQLSLEISDSEHNIGIVCTNDFKTYASLLAIWFSGLAYVPLGLQNPVDRNLSILKDAGISSIISSINLDDERYNEYKIIRPDIAFPKDPTKLLDISKYRDHENAYILFTSGSTGLPKGVPISYNSLNQFVINFLDSPFKVNENDRCLQMFELTFDVSISSFLIPMIQGACVYTVNDNTIKYIEVLKLLHNYKLTCIQIVPSIIRLASPLLKKFSFSDVQFCILTGEATHIELLQLWKSVIPNSKIFNYYGPTEATIYCSYYECNSAIPKKYNGMLAIGNAMGNMKLKIVDSNFNELENNEKGEMLISGPQLTAGYFNNESKNKEAFINLIENDNPVIYYRSGDLCFKDSDGDIYYCGRLDNQVKVQGFRVELSEIEVTVRDKFNVNNVVVNILNKAGSTELVLTLENNGRSLSDEIHAYLKSKLPNYMVPSKIMELDNFPLGSSGKTDRSKITQWVKDELFS